MPVRSRDECDVLVLRLEGLTVLRFCPIELRENQHQTRMLDVGDTPVTAVRCRGVEDAFFRICTHCG